MRFVEESDGTFSAAQLAAAERELEEQKKEWELDRLRAMREEEERQKRMSDDDENPLTFSREDSKIQVNNSNSSRRAYNKLGRLKINNRGRRGNRGRRPSVRDTGGRKQRRVSRRSIRLKTDEEQDDMTSSDSELDTLTDLDSQDDDIARNSSDDRHSSRVSSSDEEGTDDNEDGDDEKENNETKEEKDYPSQTPTKNKSISNCKKNHFDINSPRTRSSGNVKINLWTLDVSPILPDGKLRHRGQKSKNCS